MKRRGWLIALALVLGLTGATAGGVWISARIPAPRATLPARTGPALGAATSWGYQLQGARPGRVPDAIDLFVTDYSRDGSEPLAFSRADIDAFRRRADGRGRIVLAYLSIGEAETYRAYWKPAWRTAPPPWLGQENRDWRGNFAVRFWEPAWQRIFLDAGARTMLDAGLEVIGSRQKPYLDRLIDAGFDGVYLDRIDAYEEAGRNTIDARVKMVRFIARIAAYAKARRPGFIVMAQNGEDLLANPEYRRAIDGIAKEDLIFGAEGKETANSAEDVARARRLLDRARADRLPVFVVEYLQSGEKRQIAAARARDFGYLLTFAVRELNTIPELPAASASPVGDRTPGVPRPSQR